MFTDSNIYTPISISDCPETDKSNTIYVYNNDTNEEIPFINKDYSKKFSIEFKSYKIMFTAYMPDYTEASAVDSVMRTYFTRPGCFDRNDYFYSIFNTPYGKVMNYEFTVEK